MLLALALPPGGAAAQPPAPAATAEPQPHTPDSPAPVWSVPVAHAGGLLLGMRVAVSVLWPESYDPFAWGPNRRQFIRAYLHPPELRGDRPLLESDGDPWTINLVGHGLFGSEVFQRARRCGVGPLGALVFTTGASAVWEYGLEAFHKRPSAVDLVVTTAVGGALGEARFRLQRIAARRPPGVLRRLLLIVSDPLGEAERGVIGTRC